MSAIPPGVFTFIIIGSFLIAAVIVGIADSIKAIRNRRKRSKRYREYELSRRKRIRSLRRKRFQQDADNMEIAYKAMVNYKADCAIEWLRCRHESGA